MVDDQPPDGGAGDEHEVRIDDVIEEYEGLAGEFYRGEIDRTSTWRARLDQTTNWAVVVVAAILTWAFTSANNPHFVILIGMFGVAAFLVMEATRYREYDVWRNRVRLLQSGLFAELFSGKTDAPDWREQLGEQLLQPEFNITFRQALTHRLRRSYLALLLLLLAAWFARITVFLPDQDWRQTASIFIIPGEVVVGIVAAFYAVVILIAVWSARESRVQEFEE
ncbi:DUF2270 domain-containing protein [Halomicrobium salinisoli]|uniref:DUF2270 domain-containing protein n=1 Tax=Halomicrobium salinisoli TaxID=2878391 RepID=UPI001CF0308A|nr:DUF2270 domain-containing protein [Halomicrobium salinisoli]